MEWLSMAVPRPRRPKTPTLPAALACVVKRAPGSLSAPLSVVVPAYDRQQLYTIKRWMPRGTDLPAVGDKGLIVQDETDEPWLVAWWPS